MSAGNVVTPLLFLKFNILQPNQAGKNISGPCR